MIKIRINERRKKEGKGETRRKRVNQKQRGRKR